MNIVEYMAALDSRSLWMSGPLNTSGDLHAALRTGADGSTLARYKIFMIIMQKSGIPLGVAQDYYVKNEGVGDEEVLPTVREWENESSDAFEDEVRTFVDGFVTADRPKIVINQVNAENRFAMCTAYEVVDGAIVTKPYFLSDEGNGVVIRPYSG
jgi:hypothetical protein